MGLTTIAIGRIVLGATVTAILCGGPARAQTASERPSIAVEGQAAADLAPDAATMQVGVEAERSAVSEATAEAARAAAAVARAIEAEGIDARDVRTTSVVLTPVYPENPPPNARSLPRAYRASTTFALTVRPPELAGLVLARLVDKGVTGIDGLAFTAADEEKTRDRLRGEAVADARRKAELYVQALGLHLAGVLEISPEETGAPAPGFMRAKSMAAAPTPPIPVEPGLLHLREQVRVRWAIAP